VTTAELLAAVARGFRWWGGELAGMLPAALRPSGPRLVVDLSGASPMVARRVQGGGWRACAPLDADGARLFASEAEVVLAVPPDWIMRRTLRLPEAAEARLDAVLEFEVEQHIPFVAREVLWTARIAERLPEQQRIEVAVAILPRRLVEAAAARLRAAGLKARLLVRSDPEAAWPSLSLEALSPAGRRLRPVAEAALAGLAGLLSLHLALGELRRGEAVAAAVEARAAAAREGAEQVLALEAEAASLRTRLALAADIRGGRPAAVAVLEEVARLLPDEAWLTEFRLTGDQVVVAGFAARADSLLGLLDASPMLREVRFAAPVTRDRPDAPERFQVAMRTVPPSAVLGTTAR
jgi:general secretion pathway protein L